MLGDNPVGLDLSVAMLRLAKERMASGDDPLLGQGSAGHTPPLVQGDLARLPFARGTLGGVWASRTLVHLSRTEVPLALAELHRVIEHDGVIALVVFAGDEEAITPELKRWVDDPFPGRSFSYWDPDHLRDVVAGAGFEVLAFSVSAETGHIKVLARRDHTLPDFVGANMGVLLCGLNPSPASADAGVGFFRAGNRFWPAALKSGLVSRDRDPSHALLHHGVGMTDLAKRTTRRADELRPDEYQSGIERVARIATWLQPRSICMVGLAGWRAAFDRNAKRGWQTQALGGRPVYVMPSTSGLNAHDTVASLTEHLRRVAAGPT